MNHLIENSETSLDDLLHYHILQLSNGIWLFGNRAYNYMYINELEQAVSEDPQNSCSAEQVLEQSLPNIKEIIDLQSSFNKLLSNLLQLKSDMARTIQTYSSGDHDYGPDSSLSDIQRSFGETSKKTLNFFFNDINQRPLLNPDAYTNGQLKLNQEHSDYLDYAILKELRALHTSLNERY
ncbi:TPA: hypothetical protein MW242_003048 [Acinetobacter baumannii]|nr:hypothetical protein [Acinetobacter baumannii]